MSPDDRDAAITGIDDRILDVDIYGPAIANSASPRLPKYPGYKDSGAEWLGEIPADWRAMKVKRLSIVRRGASPRPIDDPSYFEDDGDYAWVRIADVTASERYLEETTQRLSPLGKSKSVALEPGELFVSIAATVGKPIITKIKCCIHDGFVYFVDLRENRDFIYYLFSCGEPYKGLGKLGTQLNLNTDTIGDIVLPIPSDGEQEAVVLFLDRETAKIDSLIAKKERLIELLHEKRTALITRAVTKGLDPNVPMKDSGVEWFEDLPAHWRVTRPRFLCDRIVDGVHHTPAYVDDGIPFITVKNLTCVDDGISFDDTKFISPADHDEFCRRVRPVRGDLLVTKDGTIGIARVVDTDRPFSIFVSVALLKLLPAKIHGRYLMYLFASRAIAEQSISRKIGSALTHLHLEQIAGLFIPEPPLDEQARIAAFLDRECERLDLLMVKIRGAIARLGELRTALISAAVTGKIDVRRAA